MSSSERDPIPGVAAAVRAYHADADVPRLLAALDRICASTDDTAALARAVEPYRDLHEVAGPVYERIVEREPANARALVALANAYWLTGRGSEVVGELASRALSADPSDRAAWHLWALTEPSARRRMNRWLQVTQRFPEDKLAHAALADNAISVASEEDDPVARRLAIGTYEMLLSGATSEEERSALSAALSVLRRRGA